MSVSVRARRTSGATTRTSVTPARSSDRTSAGIRTTARTASMASADGGRVERGHGALGVQDGLQAGQLLPRLPAGHL